MTIQFQKEKEGDIKVRLFIALLLLAGMAVAEKPAKEPGFAWVKGSETPEAIPEWNAARALQQMATSTDGGAEMVQQITGLSDAGMRALVTHAMRQESARAADNAGHRQRHRLALCNTTTTKEQVIVVRHRLAEEYQNREQARVEGVYAALGATDAEKLRIAAREFRKSITAFGVSDPNRAYDETINYLSDLCGGAP